MTYTPYADEVAEAEAVAVAVERLREAGTPPGEVAVLFRINAQSEAFEEALAARGIPYVVRGAARFFDRAEVRQAVTLLRGAARGGTTVEDDLPSAVRAVLSVMGWTPEAPAARGQTRDRWESLQALVDQAAEQAEAGVTEPGTSSTSSTAARPSSTPQSPAASPWPPSISSGSRRRRCSVAPGDRIALDEKSFTKLAAAYFDEIEAKFT